MTPALTWLAIGLGVLVGAVITWPIARWWERNHPQDSIQRSVGRVVKDSRHGGYVWRH